VTADFRSRQVYRPKPKRTAALLAGSLHIHTLQPRDLYVYNSFNPPASTIEFKAASIIGIWHTGGLLHLIW